MWGHVDTRIPGRRPDRTHGAISVQFLLILVPVLLGMMGFALDLGRLYLIRGELNQAASAMALAAASQLNGTASATTAADAAAQATLDNSLSTANKYNFGSIIVGQPTASLTSNVPGPAYFATAQDALTAYGQISATSGADGSSARHATVNLTAEAPLLFWGLLARGQSRKTTIAASAAAGVSAPLCTACGIVPFAIADLSAGSDVVNFGYTVGTAYTFGFNCTGAVGGSASAFAGTTRISYVIINKSDPNPIAALFASDDDQLFRDSAQGLVPSTGSAYSCSTIGGAETLWPSASAFQACAVGTPIAAVQNAMCGLSTRLTDSTPVACASVTNIGTLASAYSQDTDVINDTDLTQTLDYTQYTGNNRRLITVAVVDSLTTLNVLGFRQFLLIPTPGTSPLSNFPADGDGRFVGLYAGSQTYGAVAPVAQGSITGSCGVSAGPGKVVLLR